MQENGRRCPKSLADLATDALCRSLPQLDGELPAGLPQDVIDQIVRSLISHSALNATTLRILRLCPLAELDLTGCRGVTDQWLAPLHHGSAPALYPSDDSMECQDEEEEDDEAFFSSMETKNSSDTSSCSTETFLSAACPPAPCLTSYLTTLDLRGSQRLTDQGLMQLTQLCRLQVARLDHCHSLQGQGLVVLEQAHHLHTLSLDHCRRLTDEAVLHLSHLISLENLRLSFSNVSEKWNGCRN